MGMRRGLRASLEMGGGGGGGRRLACGGRARRRGSLSHLEGLLEGL